MCALRQFTHKLDAMSMLFILIIDSLVNYNDYNQPTVK